MKLRTLPTLLLMLSATFTSLSGYAEDTSLPQTAVQASTERLDGFRTCHL